MILTWGFPGQARRTPPSLQRLEGTAEFIYSVEEVREFPALGDALETVNTPDSTFRSVKCGIWSTHELTEEKLVDVEAANKVGTYVDLIFNVPGFNYELEQYFWLGEKLDRILKYLKAPASIDFVIRPCVYHPQEAWGYFVTLSLNAYVPRPSEATQV